MTAPRFFAIVPAAGRSERMGQPKLLLEWHGRTMLDEVLSAWTASEVSHVIVVIRRDDGPLQEVCQRWPVDVVRPETDPRDMKESLQCGLRRASTWQPSAGDFWCAAPADLPELNVQVINRLIAAAGGATQIVAPRYGGRTGHPLLLPWSTSSEVFGLGPEEGIDQIVLRHACRYVDFSSEAALRDIDTPADYRQLRANARQPDKPRIEVA